MPKTSVNTMTLEPITAIISFDAISYRTFISVSGTIGHYRYPNDSDYNKNKSAFYKSVVGRRNKQKISEVISEIYAYLNTRISPHADTSDYFFRISFKLEVAKESAEILGTPAFDIDVYRYIGKIGGKHSNVGKYVMSVIIIDREKMPLSPIFKKGISKAKAQAEGLIEFTVYQTYSAAPTDVKARVSKDSYYLLIDKDEYKIEPAIDQKTNDIIYTIKEEGNTKEFRSEDEITQFILKKLKISPKIIGSETGLTSSIDKEINEISKEIETQNNEQKTDLIAQLGIEQILTILFNKLDGTKTRGKSDRAKQKERLKAKLDDLKREFTSSKVEYEVNESELVQCKEEYERQQLTEEAYRIRRVRTLKAMGLIKSKLIEMQQTLKEKITPEIMEFIEPKGAK